MLIGIDYTAAARQGAGIGRYTRELVTALLALESRHNYAVFAATGQLPRSGWRRQVDNLRAISKSPLAVHTLPLSDKWLARLWHRLRLPLPVETITGPIDAYYSPDFVLPPTRAATRTLLTVHDLTFLRCPDAFEPALRRYLERAVPRSIARANLVLADSAHTRSDILSFFSVPAGKVQVLYGGVHPRFRPEPQPSELQRLKDRYGIAHRPYVLSVGTLQPRKNYVRLIRACASLGPKVQLAIAGGRGWLYEDILSEADKHSDQVCLLGFVREDDLPALYREAALFVFPSLYEGFGLPVLEAMACGVPVVCSNASSLPEITGEAALLVEPLDVEALAQAMVRALENADLRRQMVARGLAQAARFTWERAARQLLDAFNRLENTWSTRLDHVQ